MKDIIQKTIKKSMMEILGIEYMLLVAYFKEIRETDASLVVFITRRCFILYNLFVFVEEWESLINIRILSDRGIWAYRHELNNADKIIVADDLLLYGKSMAKVIEKLKRYIPQNCSLVPTVYCRYEKSSTDIGNYTLKYICSKDRYNFNYLSDKLVRCITDNGIPYSTFVYPWFGNGFCYKFPDESIQFNPFKGIYKKWNQSYNFAIKDEIKKTVGIFSKSSCIRIYNSLENDGMACVMPFCFVNDIKKEYINRFFESLRDVLSKSGDEIFSKEIQIALDDSNESHFEDKWIYLTNIFSCLLSKYIGIEMDLDNWFSGDCSKEIVQISIKGSFPEHIVKAFMEMDKVFTSKLKEQIELSQVDWQEFFIENPVYIDNKESKKESSKSSIFEKLLEHYFNIQDKHLGNKKTCVNSIIDLFQDIRNRYETNSGYLKFIPCFEVFNSHSSQYEPIEIYASQIFCWDLGIASYSFKYDDNYGLISINGIGERSALILSLRYIETLDRYFAWEMQQRIRRKKISIEKKKRKLNRLMKDDKVRQQDRDILLKDINKLYEYYIS